VLTTDQKGSIAEMAIAWEAIKLGIDVYKPLNDGTRYDLIFDLGEKLIRVQCKWATRYDDVIIVRCYSCRRARTGMIKRGYTPEEVDAFAAYCMDTDRCYFLPIEQFPRRAGIQLRLNPTRNNQQRGINWAEEYEFGATLRSPGAVAQLGERLPGRQ
jgi:hypothetical protein